MFGFYYAQYRKRKLKSFTMSLSFVFIRLFNNDDASHEYWRRSIPLLILAVVIVMVNSSKTFCVCSIVQPTKFTFYKWKTLSKANIRFGGISKYCHYCYSQLPNYPTSGHLFNDDQQNIVKPVSHLCSFKDYGKQNEIMQSLDNGKMRQVG